MLTRKGLMKAKAGALRHRVWLNATSRLERGIINLTIRCVERIRSPVLIKAVSKILKKITTTLENSFLETVNRIGSALAEKVCRIGETWGNETASDWKCDLGFIRFLGINAANSIGFSISEGGCIS